MRVSPVVSAALILFMSAPAFAQEYVEFVSRQDRLYLVSGLTPLDPKFRTCTLIGDLA